MNGDYTSFLICFRGDEADVFQNGLPIGVFIGGAFRPHRRQMPDGTMVQIEVPSVVATEAKIVCAAMIECAKGEAK